jgi:thiol-disulfide isomerase/thioredoxin
LRQIAETGIYDFFPRGDISMRVFTARTIPLFALWLLIISSSVSVVSAQSNPAVEKRIVDYLREHHMKPKQPVVVSKLLNNVFTGEEERKEINRLFNVFFKIPLFVVQHKVATDRIPTLADISRQFNLRVAGEADVLLSVMELDPRIPKFMTRNRDNGEILSVDIEAVKSDPRFSQAIERTLAGWSGRTAPEFTLDLFSGDKISSKDLSGKNCLIYFWYSGCPPCMKLSPYLSKLQEKYADSNFLVLAVNTDRLLGLNTTDEERAAYIEENALRLEFAHSNREMQEAYGNVGVYPTFFLVDSKGVIRDHYIGDQSPEVLTSGIGQILGIE